MHLFTNLRGQRPYLTLTLVHTNNSPQCNTEVTNSFHKTLPQVVLYSLLSSLVLWKLLPAALCRFVLFLSSNVSQCTIGDKTNVAHCPGQSTVCCDRQIIQELLLCLGQATDNVGHKLFFAG